MSPARQSILVGLVLSALLGCTEHGKPAAVGGTGPADQGAGSQRPRGAAPDQALDVRLHGARLSAPVAGYSLIATFPHDPGAYTQGLLIEDGQLFESTGQVGRSSVRRVELESGEVAQAQEIPGREFGEGLAAYGELLFQLTWKARTVFVYDRRTLQRLGYTYSYPTEGWGLATSPDGSQFAMSDGSDKIRFIDPKGFRETGFVNVTDGGRPVRDLNELEWIGDEIWANVWKSDLIARINPENGVVRSWVNLEGIFPDSDRLRSGDEVLNGIAYDRATDAIYVTGKHWPHLYQISVPPKGD